MFSFLNKEILDQIQLGKRTSPKIVKLLRTEYADILDKFKLDIKGLIWHLKNKKPLMIHTCKVCGNPVKFNPSYNRFNYYCSKECAKKDKSAQLEKQKQTLLNKYNVTNISQIPSVKLKKKQLSLDKYGTSCPLLALKEKTKETNIKKYGIECSVSSKSIRDKINQTNLTKFGNKCSLVNPLVKAKSIITLEKKYGVTNIFKYKNTIENNRHKSYEKTYVSIIKRSKDNTVKPLFTKEQCIGSGYNTSYEWLCTECNSKFKSYYANGKIPICRKCHPYSISKPQEEIINFIKSLTKYSLSLNNKELIKPYELDIYIPDLKIAIEVNGDYWHSNLFKDKNYHLNKTKLCEEKGIRLIHIFESEWIFKQDKIKRLLTSIINNVFNFEKQILKIDRRFFNKSCFNNNFKLIKTIPPSLISLDKENKFWNCGYLILSKG